MHTASCDGAARPKRASLAFAVFTLLGPLACSGSAGSDGTGGSAGQSTGGGSAEAPGGASGGNVGAGQGSGGVPGGDVYCDRWTVCPTDQLCVRFADSVAKCAATVPDDAQVVCSLDWSAMPCEDDTVCRRYGASCNGSTHTCVCMNPICEPGANKTCNADPTLPFAAGYCGPGGTCSCADIMQIDWETGKCKSYLVDGRDPCANGACDGQITLCNQNSWSGFCHLAPAACLTKMTCLCACPQLSSGNCGFGTTGCTCTEVDGIPSLTCHGA
jgi:hypothetical protein